MLTKKKAADKSILLAHRIVFGRPGEAAKRKASLRLFNGLPASSQDKGGLEAKLAGQTIPALRDLCILFNLERSGEKNAMAARIAAFLVSPKDFGKSKAVATITTTTTKKKAAAAKKAKASSKPAAKKAKTNGKKSELSAEIVDSDEDYTEEIQALQSEQAAA